MTNEQIEQVVDAFKCREAVVAALMEQRSVIDRKLRILGVDGVPEPEKPKIGRPKGSKSRAKEPIQIPPQITEACRTLEDEQYNEAQADALNSAYDGAI